MGNLYVTKNGEDIAIDPEMFILLYMPAEMSKDVQAFLNKHNLQEKFDIVNASITIRWDNDEDEGTVNDPIKSLCLRMRDEKVLFEYKLSGRADKLLTNITDYVHGDEKD